MFFNQSMIFLIIIGAIIITGYFLINKLETSRVKRFQLIISYLGGISALLITYNIYLNMRSNNVIEKNRMAYNTISNIDNSYLKPLKEIIDYFPEGFFLYASINPDMNFSNSTPVQFNESKRILIESYGSLRIYQAMESFLTIARYDLTGIPAWINIFLSWMQSPILQKNWVFSKANFSDDTVAFIDRIIPKANTLTELRAKKGHLTREDYDAISSNFLVVPRQ